MDNVFQQVFSDLITAIKAGEKEKEYCLGLRDIAMTLDRQVTTGGSACSMEIKEDGDCLFRLTRSASVMPNEVDVYKPKSEIMDPFDSSATINTENIEYTRICFSGNNVTQIQHTVNGKSHNEPGRPSDVHHEFWKYYVAFRNENMLHNEFGLAKVYIEVKDNVEINIIDIINSDLDRWKFEENGTSYVFTDNKGGLRIYCSYALYEKTLSAKAYYKYRDTYISPKVGFVQLDTTKRITEMMRGLTPVNKTVSVSPDKVHN